MLAVYVQQLVLLALCGFGHYLLIDLIVSSLTGKVSSDAFGENQVPVPNDVTMNNIHEGVLENHRIVMPRISFQLQSNSRAGQ